MASADTTEDGYQLLVSFPDQSPPFTYGFEAGNIWAMLTANLVSELNFTTRVENREVIMRMAAARGWRIDVKLDVAEGWDDTTFVKIGPGLVTPNPHGLRVVGSK